MSKANEVDAYRFNPNGTPEEILANNPGVFRGADGKYYIPNKWSPNEPYLIDPSKEQMIMMYGGDDMAVCDGAIFKGSYVDNLESMSYQDPSKLAYGEVGRFTKQAPGAFKVMPEGTKIQTLEGVRTVGEGEVVALDHAGNPYATTPANILKRNIGFSQNAENTLNTMKLQSQNNWLESQGVEYVTSYVNHDPLGANPVIKVKINGETVALTDFEAGKCSVEFGQSIEQSQNWLYNFITQQRKSGLSLEEFCKTKNINLAKPPFGIL